MTNNYLNIHLSDFFNPLGNEVNKAIETLATASNTPSLLEQEKIWLDLIKLKNSFPPKKQQAVLTSFICSKEVSPHLQKKAIQQFAKEINNSKTEEYQTDLCSIASAAKNGNRDDIMAITESLLQQKNADNSYTLFSVFESITIQNKHLTEDFVANPYPYFKLLTGIVQKYPYEKKSSQILDTLNEGINKSTSGEKLKPLFNQTASAVFDIMEQEEIRQIKELYAWKKELLGITPHNNNNAGIPKKSPKEQTY